MTASVRRFLLALFTLMTCIAQATGDGFSDPYRVKAAFLYNFAKFVEWPPEAFKDGNDRISICVLGKNPFGAYLTQAVDGKTVNNRRFAVSVLSAAADARACHILFVVAPQSKSASTLLDEAKNPYLLIVGESTGFLAGGGVINLKVEDSRIRIEIHRETASRAKYRISSKLLSLAAED